MSTLIKIILRFVNNRQINAMYRAVMRIEVYKAQFVLMGFVIAFGSALMYAVDKMWDGNTMLMAAVVIFTAFYGMSLLASLDKLVIGEWRRRFWTPHLN